MASKTRFNTSNTQEVFDILDRSGFMWTIDTENMETVTIECNNEEDRDILRQMCPHYPDIEEDDDEREPSPVQVMNDKGFYDFHDSEGNCVCPQCQCLVMKNTGQGSMCTECQHEFDVECEHDMHDGIY